MGRFFYLKTSSFAVQKQTESYTQIIRRPWELFWLVGTTRKPFETLWNPTGRMGEIPSSVYPNAAPQATLGVGGELIQVLLRMSTEHQIPHVGHTAAGVLEGLKISLGWLWLLENMARSALQISSTSSSFLMFSDLHSSSTGLLVHNLGKGIVVVIRGVAFQVRPWTEENAPGQNLLGLPQLCGRSYGNSWSSGWLGLGGIFEAPTTSRPM